MSNSETAIRDLLASEMHEAMCQCNSVEPQYFRQANVALNRFTEFLRSAANEWDKDPTGGPFSRFLRELASKMQPPANDDVPQRQVSTLTAVPAASLILDVIEICSYLDSEGVAGIVVRTEGAHDSVTLHNLLGLLNYTEHFLVQQTLKANET